MAKYNKEAFSEDFQTDYPFVVLKDLYYLYSYDWKDLLNCYNIDEIEKYKVKAVNLICYYFGDTQFHDNILFRLLLYIYHIDDIKQKDYYSIITKEQIKTHFIQNLPELLIGEKVECPVLKMKLKDIWK